MKKFLLPENATYYKANMHSHSMVSDGNFTPEEMKEVYMAEGYSIVAYTDHDVIVDHSDLIDESFVALTGTEYSITDHDVSPIGLYDMSGADMDFNFKKVVHMNLFAKDPHNGYHTSYNPKYIWGRAKNYMPDEAHRDGEDYERVLSTEGLNDMIRRANEAGFFVCFNHPYWSNNRLIDFEGLEGLHSLEVYNYAADYNGGMDYCIDSYEWMLRAGKRVFPLAGDDNHNWKKETNTSFGGYTMIAAPSLTYKNVIDSLLAGNFYACVGRGAPEIKNLYVEDNRLYVDFSPAADVYVNTAGRLILSAHAKPGETFTHAEFDLKEDYIYFRVTVQDDHRRRAHTGAYYTKDIL